MGSGDNPFVGDERSTANVALAGDLVPFAAHAQVD